MSRFVVAVTGGIASGKSETCRCFERRGIAIADADVFARTLVGHGQPALEAIIGRFGDGVLSADGSLDRASLRRLVFENEPARRDLESILHPRIRDALRDACATAESPYAIAAIPLLAEGGGRASYPWIDRILVVDVPRETQVQRLLVRDGGAREQAARILAAQTTREQRIAIADDLIENGGTREALSHRVGELHAFYLRLAAAKS